MKTVLLYFNFMMSGFSFVDETVTASRCGGNVKNKKINAPSPFFQVRGDGYESDPAVVTIH